MSKSDGLAVWERVRVRIRIEEMSAPEAAERIGAARFTEIRGRDGDAMFVDLVAAHEGVSSGRLVSGRGAGIPARKFWSRERIGELVGLLGRGVPVYVSHEGPKLRRRPVGEVVAAAERWFKGVLSAAGTAYIRDAAVRERIRSGELDACSIEAEIECHRDPEGDDVGWVVDAVRRVTGIALGDSRRERPGFANAGVVAGVAEFADEREEEVATHVARTAEEKITELEGRVELQERQLKELGAKVDRLRKARPSGAGIAAPPEKAGTSRDNPLIPRTKGW